jgi:ABC-type transport system involved in multi-copper enzyme maturation permease subunit
VLAHELRGSLFGRKEQFGRALYVVTIGTELLLILLGRRSEALTLLPLLLRGYGVGSVVAVLAVGAVLGALTFSLEREQRRLALLLTTRLTARAMVWGKYAAACYYTGYLVLASLPVTGFACLLGFLPLRAALLVTAGLLVWGGWATAMGLWCSLIFPRARSAVGAALGVVLALVGGSALAAGLMPTVFRPEHPVLALLPPYVTNCFMSGFAPGIMPSLTTSCTGAGSMMNGALIYLACLVPLLGLAPWLFERFVRRAESA